MKDKSIISSLKWVNGILLLGGSLVAGCCAWYLLFEAEPMRKEAEEILSNVVQGVTDGAPTLQSVADVVGTVTLNYHNLFSTTVRGWGVTSGGVVVAALLNLRALRHLEKEKSCE